MTRRIVDRRRVTGGLSLWKLCMLFIADAYEHIFKGSLRAYGLSDPSAHVLAGLIIFFGAALLLRRPLHSPLPILAVFAAEAVNEWLDSRAFADWRWPDTLDDIVRTFVGPLPIYLVTCWVDRPAARLALELAAQEPHDPPTGRREPAIHWLGEQRGRKDARIIPWCGRLRRYRR